MDKRIVISVTDELTSSIDEWRRHQIDIPPRAEAIRRLIERGILLGDFVMLAADLLEDAETKGLEAQLEQFFDLLQRLGDIPQSEMTSGERRKFLAAIEARWPAKYGSK